MFIPWWALMLVVAVYIDLYTRTSRNAKMTWDWKSKLETEISELKQRLDDIELEKDEPSEPEGEIPNLERRMNDMEIEINDLKFEIDRYKFWRRQNK